MQIFADKGKRIWSNAYWDKPQHRARQIKKTLRLPDKPVKQTGESSNSIDNIPNN